MLPWLHRYTDERGWQKVCCLGAEGHNQLHDQQGRPMHVTGAYTEEQILNSPGMKTIRRSMMRGEWPAVCQGCQWAEEAGAASGRTHANRRFDRFAPALLSRTTEDGTLEQAHVHSLDIRLGNVCNLTCRMCDPVASRPWVDHYNAVQPREYLMPAGELTALRESNWVKRKPVEQILEPCLPSLEHLHFAGGEPLIIPEMIDALDLCVRSGRAGQIDLSYNSNITVLPERAVRLWPHFRSVSLYCSVDGVGPLNDYIRHPSQWKDVDRNLHLLDSHYAEWKLRTLQVNATVQVYNLLQLDELFDYLSAGFEHVTPLPILNALFYPKYLSIQILPSRLKEAARERLLEARVRAEPGLRPQWRFALANIDSTIAFMNAASPRHLADFLYFSEKSDREFGGSWRQACPELARLLERRDTEGRQTAAAGVRK
jgi:hypothetical protein